MAINDLTATKGEIREKVFEVWYSSGMNDTAAVRECAKLGLSITRPTLAAWRKKYCWQERASAADALKLHAAEAVQSAEYKLIADLMKQKERYDNYFESLPTGKIDNQAMFAYGNLCKQIIELTWKKKKNDEESSSAQSEGVLINVNFIDAVKRPENESGNKADRRSIKG